MHLGRFKSLKIHHFKSFFKKHFQTEVHLQNEHFQKYDVK